MKSENNYQLLIRKLDEFIRKYYVNKILKGAIYTTSILLLLYLTIAFSEYLGHFSSLVRGVLFYGFIATSLFVVSKLIVSPLLKLYRLGPTLSHDKAAEIVGRHFQDVQDKLLNTLQLHRQLGNTQGTSKSLILASIDQKILDLQPIPFTAAIDFSRNRKYLKYLLPVLLLALLVLLVYPSIYTTGTQRILSHNKTFLPAAPFQFLIVNKDLTAPEQTDFQLNVELSGSVLPDRVFVEYDGFRYAMEKQGVNRFSFVFRNIQKSKDFRLFGGGFFSDAYRLEAIPNPILMNFSIRLNYPEYLKRKNETVQNTGDLIVPQGTAVTWNFQTRNASQVNLSFSDTVFALKSKTANHFPFSKQFFKSTPYSISIANDILKNPDSIAYRVDVIPDLHPEISVEQQQDSLSRQRLYFSGKVKDDYGFSRLTFHYRFLHKKDSGRSMTQSLPLQGGATFQQFFHAWDLSSIGVSAGDEVLYYFEVWDNDGVNGNKSSRTSHNVYKAPTLKEIAEEVASSGEKLKENLKNSLQEARELQKEAKALQKELLQKKNLSWQEKEKVRDLLERQQNLQNSIENIQQENAKSNAKSQEFLKMEESILSKQQQLNELFEQVMTDEMKSLFQELEEMLNQLDKEALQESLEKIELNNEDIEKELDRTLEIFKQLELEQKLENTAQQLDELGEKQSELSDKSENKTEEAPTLEKEQQELNKAFEKVQEDLEDLQQKNQELESPLQLEDTQTEEEQIKENMKQSEELLNKGKEKKAAEQQKKAAEQMKNLAERLRQMMQSGQSQSVEEDLNALRALLENLITLSFDQEENMHLISQTNAKDPKYVTLTQRQKNLKEDASMIEDSLFALSKRIIQLQSTINREMSAVNQHMNLALGLLEDRKTSQATLQQQYAMTSLNNLALLLDEALRALQQQMASQMDGQGMCQKPGSGKGAKPSVSSLRSLQKQLSEQIEKMKKAMEEGQKPGPQKGNNPGGMNKSIAKLAAEQAAIRQEIEKMSQELNKDGKGSGNQLKKIAKEMEENEVDLVNKNITRESIKRQEEILTRLLEAEKAERERGYEKERTSREAKNDIFSNPGQYFEYNKKKEREAELLKTIPPELKPYYREKVNDYFNKFED